MKMTNNTSINEFLKSHGDMVYFKLLNSDLINLKTDEGIDLFFLKIDEFIDEFVDEFNIDIFLNDNKYLIDYYWNLKEPETHLIVEQEKTNKCLDDFDNQINFYLKNTKKISLNYLLDYMQPQKDALERVSVLVEAPVFDHYSFSVKKKKFELKEDFNIFETPTTYRHEVHETYESDIYEPDKYIKAYDPMLYFFIDWLFIPCNINIAGTFTIFDVWFDIILNKDQLPLNLFAQITPDLESWWYENVFFIRKNWKQIDLIGSTDYMCIFEVQPQFLDSQLQKLAISSSKLKFKKNLF